VIVLIAFILNGPQCSRDQRTMAIVIAAAHALTLLAMMIPFRTPRWNQWVRWVGLVTNLAPTVCFAVMWRSGDDVAVGYVLTVWVQALNIGVLFWRTGQAPVVDPMRCWMCDHDLNGIALDAPCPECGARWRAARRTVDDA
jgi:hypothetical protein